MDDRPRAIVEHRDASPEDRAIREINSGTYCFRVRDLLEGLKRLRPDNAKGEYYITDVIAYFVARGRRVGATACPTAMRFWASTTAGNWRRPTGC